jgi:hypothetical protein
MTVSQQILRNQKVSSFWNKLNNLNDVDYLREQKHCSFFFGGYVRGINIHNRIISLNIE